MSKEKKLNRRVRLALRRPKVKKLFYHQVDTIGLFKRLREITVSRRVSFAGLDSPPRIKTGLEELFSQSIPEANLRFTCHIDPQQGKTITMASNLPVEDAIIFSDKLVSSIPDAKSDETLTMIRQKPRFFKENNEQ